MLDSFLVCLAIGHNELSAYKIVSFELCQGHFSGYTYSCSEQPRYHLMLLTFCIVLSDYPFIALSVGSVSDSSTIRVSSWAVETTSIKLMPFQASLPKI